MGQFGGFEDFVFWVFYKLLKFGVILSESALPKRGNSTVLNLYTRSLGTYPEQITV